MDYFNYLQPSEIYLSKFKKPYKFAFFLFTMMLFLVILFLYFFKIDIYFKTNAQVKPYESQKVYKDDSNIVKNRLKDNKKVKKGDLLVQYNSSKEINAKKKLQNTLNKKIKLLQSVDANSYIYQRYEKDITIINNQIRKVNIAIDKKKIVSKYNGVIHKKLDAKDNLLAEIVPFNNKTYKFIAYIPLEEVMNIDTENKVDVQYRTKEGKIKYLKSEILNISSDSVNMRDRQYYILEGKLVSNIDIKSNSLVNIRVQKYSKSYLNFLLEHLGLNTLINN